LVPYNVKGIYHLCDVLVMVFAKGNGRADFEEVKNGLAKFEKWQRKKAAQEMGMGKAQGSVAPDKQDE